MNRLEFDSTVEFVSVGSRRLKEYVWVCIARKRECRRKGGREGGRIDKLDIYIIHVSHTVLTHTGGSPNRLGRLERDGECTRTPRNRNAYMKRALNTCKSVSLSVCLWIYILWNVHAEDCQWIVHLYMYNVHVAYCICSWLCSIHMHTHTCMYIQWNLTNLDPSNQDTSIFRTLNNLM